MATHTIIVSWRPCLKCQEIDVHNLKPDKRLVWVDHHPDFPALEVSARDGCAFCGLLRTVLLYTYSDGEVAKAEGRYDKSIQSTWPTASEWDGRVQISVGYCTATSITSRLSPQTPRERSESVIFFGVYKKPSK